MKTLKLFAIMLGSVVSFTALSQSIDTTKFYMITSKQLGEKLALTGIVSATLGNKVMLRTAREHPMQQWVFEQERMGYRIYCRHYGRAYSLEVVDPGSNSNSVSLGETVEEAPNQIWIVARDSDGYHILSLGNDKAIDVVKSGEQINQLTLKDTDNTLDYPKWQLTGTPKPTQTAASAAPVVITTPKEVVVQKSKNVIKPLLDTANRYRIMTEEMPGKSIGVESRDGRTIDPVLLPARTEAAQMWKISMNANGFYQFTNAEYSNKFLGVLKSDGESQEVVFSDDRTGSEQFWKIAQAPEGGYQITSPVLGTNVSLDFVEDGEIVNAIQMRGSNSTLWIFVPLSSKPIVTQPVVVSPSGPTNKNKLLAGEVLKVNQKIISANGAFSLVQQGDGNLVVNNSESKAIWSTGLNGKMARRSIMQADGNFTQHPEGYNQVMWSTNTKGNKGAYAMLQDDGVLTVVNQNNQIIWRSMAANAKTPAKGAATTQTAGAKSGAAGADRLVAEQELLPTKFITSANGKYKLIQQEDGNLVIYQGNRPTWSTGTNGRKIQRCVMQKDGNLVLYDTFKDAIWASNTHGNEFAYLVLQDNGNLVLYSSGGAVLWETRTGQ